MWFFQFPLLQWRYFYGTWDDNLYNTTRQIANTTNAAMVCFDALENMDKWASNKYSEFPDFTTFLMAFIQNLLGSLTIFMNIYKTIQADQLSKNYIDIAN